MLHSRNRPIARNIFLPVAAKRRCDVQMLEAETGAEQGILSRVTSHNCHNFAPLTQLRGCWIQEDAHCNSQMRSLRERGQSSNYGEPAGETTLSPDLLKQQSDPQSLSQLSLLSGGNERRSARWRTSAYTSLSTLPPRRRRPQARMRPPRPSVSRTSWTRCFSRPPSFTRHPSLLPARVLAVRYSPAPLQTSKT
jgi:hypothetical protein